METTYADQRAHDVTWMTAAERAGLDARSAVTCTMDTADRYSFGQAKALLHRQMGRKWGAYALFHAGMDGECTVGGTTVSRVGAYFTITDA